MELIEQRMVWPAECRADLDASTITGIAMKYGDTASVRGMFNEQIAPGAFGRIGDVVLNVQHDRARPIARTDGGGLELRDSADNLFVKAAPVQTREGKDALLMVHHRVLRGFSVEFVADEDSFEGDVRIVKRARLLGIGLVDRPAYGESVAQVAKRMAALASRSRRRWL